MPPRSQARALNGGDSAAIGERSARVFGGWITSRPLFVLPHGLQSIDAVITPRTRRARVSGTATAGRASGSGDCRQGLLRLARVSAPSRTWRHPGHRA